MSGYATLFAPLGTGRLGVSRAGEGPPSPRRRRPLTRFLAALGLGLSPAGRGRRHGPLVFAALAAALLLLGSAAAQSFPPLTGRVVDQAGIIPAQDEATLVDFLARHEAKTGNQVVVATVASLGGQTIEDYGVALGRAWGIGQQGKDNGAILLVAPNEREVRIEVGYGLEGELTDAISKVIIEGSIIPRFRSGDMVGGIRRGTEDIVAVLEGDAAAFAERARERVSGEDTVGSAINTIVFIIIMLFWLGIFGGGRRRRYRRRGGFGPIIFGGGGGFGGSSGGGWSGGGGSFGGGGASGRW